MSPDLTARFTPVLRSHEKKLKITFTISTLSLHCDPPTFDIAARAPEERWMFICRKYLGESTMYLSILEGQPDRGSQWLKSRLGRLLPARAIDAFLW